MQTLMKLTLLKFMQMKCKYKIMVKYQCKYLLNLTNKNL